MGKHWARQQVRHDEVHDVVDKGLSWIQKNRQTAGIAAGVFVAAALLITFAVSRAYSNRNAAWDRLGLAQSYAYNGMAQAALAQVDQLERDQPRSDASGFAAVFAGDILFQEGKLKESIERYTKVVEAGAPKALQPIALADLALAQEANSQPKEAAQTAQRYLEAYPDHYLAPQVHMSLARSLQAQGQAEQAKQTYQKIALQYPDTSWAAMAQAKIKGS